MENLSPFLEYGVAVFSMGALVFVIVKFLAYMSKKDAAFTEIVNHRLTEDAELKEKMIASNNAMAESHKRLEGAIGKLVDKL